MTAELATLIYGMIEAVIGAAPVIFYFANGNARQHPMERAFGTTWWLNSARVKLATLNIGQTQWATTHMRILLGRMAVFHFIICSIRTFASWICATFAAASFILAWLVFYFGATLSGSAANGAKTIELNALFSWTFSYVGIPALALFFISACVAWITSHQAELLATLLVPPEPLATGATPALPRPENASVESVSGKPVQ